MSAHLPEFRSLVGVAPLPRQPRGARFVALATAIALNVAAVAVLMRAHSEPRAKPSSLPLVATIMLPERQPPRPPPRELPKPKPVAKLAPHPIDDPPVIQQDIASQPSDESKTITVATSAEAPPPRAQAIPAPEPPPITPPRFNADYLQNPAPPYPRIARQLGERGKVMLRVLVSSQGLPERVELKTSSGSSRLDESALETVKLWKFVPARQGEQNVSAWVIVPIVFSLDS